MERDEQAAKIKLVSKKIIYSSKNELVAHLRFLDAAVNKLRLAEYEGTVCTDGKTVYYDPLFILQWYTHNKNTVTRAYLHMLLHCTFTHFYVSPQIVHDLWNLACDIAVENILNELEVSEPYLALAPDPEQQQFLSQLKQEIHTLTAEKIYRFLLDEKLPEARLLELSASFLADDHAIWYEEKKESQLEVQTPPQQKQSPSLSGGEEKEEPLVDEADPSPQNSPEKTQSSDLQSEETQQVQGSENQKEGEGAHGKEQESPAEAAAEPQPPDRDREKNLEEWKNITEHMEVDLHTFSKEKGSRVGDLLLNIKTVTRERYNYTEFLKKFASIGEKMIVNDDEFDYVYYTYGLNFYHNMPLIEPLEFKEMNVVKEFVIAIDTSFSVHGDEVQNFVKKTYNLLKAAESFSSKINLHIIQCDVKVQHDEKITTQAELDRYMKEMLLYGFGGTDFRPVFEYVNELIERKEFTNLKGLIYFTDGLGTFPEKPPAYKTAFAFISDDLLFEPVVPPWAIKLVLDPSDLNVTEK